MVDLETTDTAQTSCVLSIGIVEFDSKTGEMFNKHYYKFDADTQERTSSKDTLDWWDKQDQDIRAEAFSGTNSLEEFLRLDLVEIIGREDKVWGNGATFDISILENACQQYDTPIPWSFWNTRDVRTVVDLASGLASRGKAPKKLHDPVVDCEYQIGYLCRMIKVLRG